jgi:hypothetical protein
MIEELLYRKIIHCRSRTHIRSIENIKVVKWKWANKVERSSKLDSKEYVEKL